MLKHIVLFSLQDFESKEAKDQQLDLIKRELEALPALIPALRGLHVYFNENPQEDFDFALEALVEDMEALKAYAEHPEHLRVARQHIKPYVRARACVDFSLPNE